MSKKTQKKVMKRRRKAKQRAKRQNRAKNTSSPRTLIRRAQKFPFGPCWITADWAASQDGLMVVIVTREQPDGLLVWGSYLLDTWCLGLKDTMGDANFTQHDMELELFTGLYPDKPPAECPPELAHQMIYGAIDFAAQFDFQPQRDFRFTKHILAPRGTLEEPYDLEFGRDGKPFFVNGPYDDVAAIIAQLNRNPGPGNYETALILTDGVLPADLGLDHEADGEEDA
jgi:hypothetical protein